jgi:hypothetical protein
MNTQPRESEDKGLLYRRLSSLKSEIHRCKGLYTLLVIGDFLINRPLRLPNDLLNS